MCEFKSLVLTKDKAYCPDHDGHSKMVEELGIRDVHTPPCFVKIEITPPDGDPFAPLDQWAYRVDQDSFPEWYIEEVDKPRAFTALAEWAKTHIFVGVNGLSLTEGAGYYLKDCKGVTLSGSSRVDRMVGSSRVGCMDGSSSVGCMVGSSRVDRMDGSSSVGDVFQNAAIGSAAGEVCISTLGPVGYDWKNKGSLILSENATYRDCIAHVIYQAGDWSLTLVSPGSAIKDAQ